MPTPDPPSVFDAKTISYLYEAWTQRAANEYVAHQPDYLGTCYAAHDVENEWMRT